MAPSIVEIAPLPESSPLRLQSPAEVESGFYQQIPPRRWYHDFFDNINPMPLKQRTHPYPHHIFVPRRTPSPVSPTTKHEFGFTRTPTPRPIPEPLITSRVQVATIAKLASLIVPVTVLCFL